MLYRKSSVANHSAVSQASAGFQINLRDILNI